MERQWKDPWEGGEMRTSTLAIRSCSPCMAAESRSSSDCFCLPSDSSIRSRACSSAASFAAAWRLARSCVGTGI